MEDSRAMYDEMQHFRVVFVTASIDDKEISQLNDARVNVNGN